MTPAEQTGTAEGEDAGGQAAILPQLLSGPAGQSSGANSAQGRKPRRPPHAYFLVSAVFHYLGPALAVLLFAQTAPLGVAWLRIASAAVVFLLWRRSARLWRLWRGAPARDPGLGVPLGGVRA